MLKVHTSDGQTSLIDLKDEAQAKEMLGRFRALEVQRQITGISITKRCSGRFYCHVCDQTTKAKCPKCGAPIGHCTKGWQFSLPRPEGFGQVFYNAAHIEPEPEPKQKVHGGEKITCFVDDLRVEIMVHADTPACKVSLLKTGKQRYNPLAE